MCHFLLAKETGSKLNGPQPQIPQEFGENHACRVTIDLVQSGMATTNAWNLRVCNSFIQSSCHFRIFKWQKIFIARWHTFVDGIQTFSLLEWINMVSRRESLQSLKQKRIDVLYLYSFAYLSFLRLGLYRSSASLCLQTERRVVGSLKVSVP